MRIIVTGTPGTGKTIVAKKIAKQRKFSYISLNSIVKEFHLTIGFDQKRQCAIVDASKLVKKVISLTKNKDCVIDGHLSHELPSRFVNECFVTTCTLPVLKKRLLKRGYSNAKIRENLDAEIFEVCLTEAREKGHTVVIVDTSKKCEDKMKYVKPKKEISSQ